jgi:hypothetical protein
MLNSPRFWESFIAVTSVLIGIGCAYFPGIDLLPAFIRVQIAASSAALVAVLALSAKNWIAITRIFEKVDGLKIGELKSTVTNLENLLRQLLENSFSAAELRSISTLHPLFRDIAFDTLAHWTESMRATHHGFRIESTDWAMQSNIAFWTSLTKFTKENAWHPQCFAIHRGDPALWKSDSAMVSLSNQAAFVDAGGTLERIFVGTCTLEQIKRGIAESAKREHDQLAVCVEEKGRHNELENWQHYGDVIRNMASHKFKIFYLQSTPSNADFAILQINQEKALRLRWTYSSDLKRVEAGEFDDPCPPDIFGLWKTLKTSAHEFTADEIAKAGPNHTHIDPLLK